MAVPDTMIQYLESAKSNMNNYGKKRADISTRYLHSDEDWLERKPGKHFDQIFGNPTRVGIELNALMYELANIEKDFEESNGISYDGISQDIFKRTRNMGQLVPRNQKDSFRQTKNDMTLEKFLLGKRSRVEKNLSSTLDELEDEINDLDVTELVSLYRGNREGQLQPKDFLSDGENQLQWDKSNQLFKNSPYAKTWLLDVLDIPMQDLE